MFCFHLCRRKKHEPQVPTIGNPDSTNGAIYDVRQTDRYVATYQGVNNLRTENPLDAEVNIAETQTTDLDEPFYDYIVAEGTISSKAYNTLNHENDGTNNIIGRISYEITTGGISHVNRETYIIGRTSYETPTGGIAVIDIEEEISETSNNNKMLVPKDNIYNDIITPKDEITKNDIKKEIYGTYKNDSHDNKMLMPKDNIYNVIENEEMYANASINRKSGVMLEKNNVYENIDFSQKRGPLYHSKSVEPPTTKRKPPIPVKRSKTLTSVDQTKEHEEETKLEQRKSLQDNITVIKKEIQILEEPEEELYIKISRKEILVKQKEIEKSVKTIEMLNKQRNLIRHKNLGVKDLINNFESKDEEILNRRINMEDSKLEKLRIECMKIINSIDEIEGKKSIK